MSIRPNDPADFTPSMGDFTELKPFRFWCQKVLPLVYDDSLSYYELLCKIVDYLNKTMEDVDTLHTDVENLHTAYEQLQEYVNDYFDNLDVQEEIDNKLDAMAQDGSLSALISPFIPNIVTEWLNEHVTPTTPIIDNTLTISGAGADAKVTGDKFKLAIINRSDNYEYTDANDINENCILFNSVSQGATVLSHTPNYAGWIQTIITGTISTQLYYPYEANVYTRPISTRQKTFSGWSEWKDLAYKELTQNKLPDIVSGDLNDYSNNSFFFISAPHTVQNTPETNAGVVSVMNFGDIIYHSFHSFTTQNTYTRFKFQNVWSEWSVMNHTDLESYLNKIVIDITNNHSYTDANSIDKNCILFNSLTSGVTTVSNTPVYAGWLQTNVIGSFALQIYYPYEANVYTRPISTRQKTFSGWSEWKDLAYKELTQNKLPDIVSGDLNDYSNNSFFFISAPHTVQNTPETNAGVVSVMNFGDIIYHSFHSFTTQNTYTRFKFQNVWSEWSVMNHTDLESYLNKIVIDITNNHSYTDANSIDKNCILFNSLTSGVTTVSNTPVYAGWLQTNVIGSFALQIYYPYESNLYDRPVSVRQKTLDGWTAWKALAYRDMVQRKLPAIGTGNANDYTESCYLFVSSPNTIQNLPVSAAGVLSVLNFDNIIMQTFTEYTNKVQYIRFKLGNNWGVWSTGCIQDLKDTRQYSSANDIAQSSIIFNSYSAGSTTISDTPNYAGWIVTYYTSSAVVCQMYIPILTNYTIKYRTKFSTWGDWIDVGSSYTKNITENTIYNTYDITTTPTITTDTNGWLAPIDTETEDETNKTDMTGAIMSMLNSTGYCHLAKGVYYVSGSIDMPAGSTLVGCGKDTKIKLLNNTTNGYAIRLHTNSTIKDLCISGNYSDIDISADTIGGRIGIYYIGNADGESSITQATTIGCTISNVRIERFNGYGFYGYNTGGNIKNGIIISNCHVYNCSVGVAFEYRCEYNKLSNSIISNCNIAVVNNGGNNTIDGCTIHGITGLLMDNSTDDMPNNSHGICSNCLFNHIGSDIDNVKDAIKAIKMNYGFIISGCQFWYGKINITNCDGFILTDCLFGSNNIEINATTKPLFLIASMFMTNPTITVPTGSKIVNCYLPNGNPIN